MFLWRELYQDVGESYNLPLKHSETMLFCIYCKPITIFNLPKAKEKNGANFFVPLLYMWYFICFVRYPCLGSRQFVFSDFPCRLQA